MTAAERTARHGVRRVVSSLRFRVTVLATVVVAALLVAVAFALVTTQHDRLTESLEATLRQRANAVAARMKVSDASAMLAGFGGQDTAAQIVAPSGRVIGASPNISDEPAIAASPSGSSPIFRTVDHLSIDNSSFRVWSRQFQTPRGPVVLHVAGNLDDVIESTQVLAKSLAVGIPVVVVFLGGLMWWLVGRTLRPVEAIRNEVENIDGTELHRRVPVVPGDDEIARLARTMNTMLDRIEAATARQRQFVSDASHELRSPLTRIRSRLEVDRAQPETADPAAARDDILEETVRLQRLVDDLLQLSRGDAGAPTEPWELVDLDDIVVRQARRLRADDRLVVDLLGVSGAQVRGAPRELARAIRNLVDNAARHADSTITFTLNEFGESARMTVADDGPGIPSDARERVFERFVRLDDARRVDDGGSGLGLAITREIVERHGGTISIQDHEPHGTQFVMTIPLSP